MKLALAITALALLCGSHRKVHALPGGAAGCGPPGVAAVGDPQHFDSTEPFSDGTLAEKGIVVTIGGQELVDGLVLPIGQDLPWTVTATMTSHERNFVSRRGFGYGRRHRNAGYGRRPVATCVDGLHSPCRRDHAHECRGQDGSCWNDLLG